MNTVFVSHHGRTVAANTEMLGRHRDICLCYACARFKPQRRDHCPAAQALFQLCKNGPITTAPVTECADFKPLEIAPACTSSPSKT